MRVFLTFLMIAIYLIFLNQGYAQKQTNGVESKHSAWKNLRPKPC